MRVIELIATLRLCDLQSEVYVKTPDKKTDFFIDSLHSDEQKKQVWIETAE